MEKALELFLGLLKGVPSCQPDILPDADGSLLKPVDVNVDQLYLEDFRVTLEVRIQLFYSTCVKNETVAFNYDVGKPGNSTRSTITLCARHLEKL